MPVVDEDHAVIDCIVLDCNYGSLRRVVAPWLTVLVLTIGADVAMEVDSGLTLAVHLLLVEGSDPVDLDLQDFADEAHP